MNNPNQNEYPNTNTSTNANTDINISGEANAITNPCVTKVIKRADYVEGRNSHNEYYDQFVTNQVKTRVLSHVSIETLLEGKDRSFNNVPLAIWDNILMPVPSEIAARLKNCGDSPTLAGCVCIAKAAARQLVTEYETLHGSELHSTNC
jgi:hypothetical protein